MFDPALESLPVGAIRALQWRCFRRLADEAFGSPGNPFLREKWGAAGIASAADLRGWDEFTRLPFTTKGELVADQAAHPPLSSGRSRTASRITCRR